MLLNNKQIDYYLKAINYYTFRLMDNLPDDILRHMFYSINKNDLYKLVI